MHDSSALMDLKSPKAACAFRIVEQLNAAGFQALFAGGCVRDYLLGAIPTDYDIATSATPDQVEKLFSRTLPVGKQFGVMLVLLDAFQFEVATFRTEGGYQDGRRPGFVKFAGAEEDALRRDFTVNGLFYDPLEKDPSKKIKDYVGGQADLIKKIIRCIGKPSERFEEDKLRLLRTIRFAVRLNFEIESSTWQEVQRLAPQIQVVSSERIRDELDKILLSAHVSRGIQLLIDGGFWKALWPEVASDDISRRFSRLAQRGTKIDIPAANAIFLLEQDRDFIIETLKRFRHSNETIQETLKILEIHQKLQKFEALRLGEIRLLVNENRMNSALLLYSINREISANVFDLMKGKLEEWRKQGLPERLLSGSDLIAAGIQPGPQMGKLIDEAYLLQLESVLKDKQAALDWVRSQSESKK